MVCGCSWSMKMNERSSAMSAPHQLSELFDHEAPDLVAHLVVLAVRPRLAGAGPELGLRAPRLEALERSERHRGIGHVRHLRPVHEVLRLEVPPERAAPEVARADRHRGR